MSTHSTTSSWTHRNFVRIQQPEGKVCSLMPDHCQQNAQWVWSSPLSDIRIARCVRVVTGVIHPTVQLQTTALPLLAIPPRALSSLAYRQVH
jgi:hypothetical protein